MPSSFWVSCCIHCRHPLPGNTKPGLPAQKRVQHWLRQVGALQRAFPNSTLELDNVVTTADETYISRLLSCTELRGITICPINVPVGRHWQGWRPMAALGRLHGSRLQLKVLNPGTFVMLVAEPSLTAHVAQANLTFGIELTWGADDSGLACQVSSLTRLVLSHNSVLYGARVLRRAGMLDALRQLPVLQSLVCLDDDMQTLLVHSVPGSWSLLTKLELSPSASSVTDAPFWSLVERQCPQLQALAMYEATSLCLTALTSLTCNHWEPQDTDSFQCSRLGHLHVLNRANFDLLPSTLTSLSLDPSSTGSWGSANLQYQQLRSQQSLVHISFTSQLVDLSHIRRLLPAGHPVLNSVTSVELIIKPQAFTPPDMDGSMAGQHFHQLGAWFRHLQRLHIHLQDVMLFQQAEVVLVSAAWLPAHWRLIVTHKLPCPVHIVKCPSGCLSLPLSSCPELR